MAVLDTNVLVRWLVNDNARQCEVISRRMSSALEAGERLFIPITVILETECVLRSRYNCSKESVTAALDALLSVAELEFQHERGLEQALWTYKTPRSPDFADCLHLALVRQADRGPLLTFDRKASRLEDAVLLR